MPQRGFTLVELMIVLMVAGLAIGLVGPVGQKQYDKVMIVKDREMLMRAVEGAGFQSFVQRVPATLELKGARFVLTRGESVKEFQFAYLRFPEQVLHLNSHGFWHETEISWIEQEQKKSAPLNPAPIQTDPVRPSA